VGNIRIERRERVVIVAIHRPEVRNAVDGPTATELADTFRSFESDDSLNVAVLTGADGTFCAGADLKAIAGSDTDRANHIEPDGDGPMGPTRLALGKPVIAAVEGYAVAGGLELALWCDLRVAAEDAVFGVFNRRFGIPLIDGGNVRLPRIIGQGRALDLILTGRPVGCREAFDIGLVNRMTGRGEALPAAVALAEEIARFPQLCLRADRRSIVGAWALDEKEALAAEFESGMQAFDAAEAQAGAGRFVGGAGRHGTFDC
jgi:enoyl-CoA hydratase